MNNRRKMNRIKKRNGIRIGKRRSEFMKVVKKIRGKASKKKYAVKVHSVTDTHFVLSTSFAMYKVPRSHSHFFEKANQKTLQNVICYRSLFMPNGKVLSTFYWYGLDSIWDTDNFKEYEITEIVDKDTK